MEERVKKLLKNHKDDKDIKKFVKNRIAGYFQMSIASEYFT